MAFLTELKQLIKYLFKSSPRKTTDLEVIQMKWFPFTGYAAMSWCGKLITKNNIKVDETLLRHETIHLKQAQQYGSWLIYYIKYLIEWFKGKPFSSPTNSAYYTIPFEVEAYANEDNKGYEINYNPNLLKEKYTFKDRKNLYKSYGSIASWKKYIKSL